MQEVPPRLHSAENPASGERRWVAAAAVVGADAGRETVLAEQSVHVGGLRADVLSGVVETAEAGDETAVRLEESETLRGLGSPVGRIVEILGDRHDALAAAPPERGEGALARHTPGQTKVVHQHVGYRAVGVEAETALRQTAACIVHSGEEEGPQALLAADEDPLVPREVLRQLEEGLQRLQELRVGEAELAVLPDHVGPGDAGFGELIVKGLDAHLANLPGEIAALVVYAGMYGHVVSGKPRQSKGERSYPKCQGLDSDQADRSPDSKPSAKTIGPVDPAGSGLRSRAGSHSAVSEA